MTWGRAAVPRPGGSPALRSRAPGGRRVTGRGLCGLRLSTWGSRGWPRAG